MNTGVIIGESKVYFLPVTAGVRIPEKGTPDSAGFDLKASEDTVIEPYAITTIPLGFSTSMPSNIHCRIESRSGMALRGAVVLTGVIDADYRGEWKVIMRNFNKDPLIIVKGDRVAQAVFRETLRIAFSMASELSESRRGAGGFGSTGQ